MYWYYDVCFFFCVNVHNQNKSLNLKQQGGFSVTNSKIHSSNLFLTKKLQRKNREKTKNMYSTTIFDKIVFVYSL